MPRRRHLDRRWRAAEFGILAGRDTWNYRTAPPAIVERVTAIAGHLQLPTGCRSPRQRCSFRWPIRRSPPSSQVPATPLSLTPISSCCATRSRPRCGRICGKQACSIPKPPSRVRDNDLRQQTAAWGAGPFTGFGCASETPVAKASGVIPPLVSNRREPVRVRRSDEQIPIAANAMPRDPAEKGPPAPFAGHR